MAGKVSIPAILLAALVAAGAPWDTSFAYEVGGVRFSERVPAGESDLVLKGAGILRYKVVFRGTPRPYTFPRGRRRPPLCPACRSVSNSNISGRSRAGVRQGGPSRSSAETRESTSWRPCASGSTG